MDPRGIFVRIAEVVSRAGTWLFSGAVLFVCIIAIVVVWEVRGDRPGFFREALPVSSDDMSMMANDGYGKGLMVFDQAYGEDVRAITFSSVKQASGIMPPVPMDPPAATGNVPTGNRKVIRNGSLNMLVESAEIAMAHIESVVQAQQGFIEGGNVYEQTEGVKAGSVTIRIPSGAFEATITALKTIAVKVIREESSSNDVTAQYVDLEAQLKNFKTEEIQYQEIMRRAIKIEDVLNVASRLAEVRGRIERVQGQLNLLSRQVDMSTISVFFTSEPSVKPTDVLWRPLTVVKESFKGLLEGLVRLADGLIRFVFYLPILLVKAIIVGLVLLSVWRLGRIIVRKVWPRRI